MAPIGGYKLTWSAGLLEIETWGHAGNSFQLIARVVGAAECWQLEPRTRHGCAAGA